VKEMPCSSRPNEGLAELLQAFRTDEQVWPSLEAWYYFEEARSCWLGGAFIACLVMCRLTLEELLRAPLAMASSETEQFKLALRGKFEELIDDAEKHGWCTPEEALELHWVRRQANSYIHTKPLGGRSRSENAKQVREHVRRWSQLDPGTGEIVAHPGIVHDAERGLRAVLRFKGRRMTLF
jgi:hypothetical protein